MTDIHCTLPLYIIMQFYIVTGGKDGRTSMSSTSSTEILKKEGGTSWQTVASLPLSRSGFMGVSLPNGHFMVSGEDDWLLFTSPMYYGISWCNITGGYNSDKTYLSDVLDYDPDADKWSKVGEMAHARYSHGMSLVQKEPADYCVCAWTCALGFYFNLIWFVFKIN